MASRAVIVTGASSGIGEATALHLRSLGFDVITAVRKGEDAERLREDGFRPLILDVADSTTIERAKADVGDEPLAGLVNNAGIAVTASIEFVPIEELREQIEVNFIGQIAVTQAFLPALRKARGRVVNMSSIGGRIALPLTGPYAASKFALEAASDSLRREVRAHGIEVIVIEPGGIKTPIWEKGTATANRIEEGAPPEADALYGELVQGLRAESQKIATETGLPPEAVAKVVGEAMTASKPKTRYLVGRDAKLRARLARIIPDRVFDRLIDRTLRT